MHTKHGFNEKLRYIRMLEEGYTIDHIKKQFGINDTQLKVMWVKYQEEGLSALCPQKRVAIVKVKTIDGEFVERVDYPKGEPENPLSKEDLEEKFRGLAMYGGLTAEECDAVIDEIWKENFSVEKILEMVCK